MKLFFLKEKYKKRLDFFLNKEKYKKRFFELYKNNIGEYNPEKTVFIIQQIFYSTSGKNFFSGGAERYCTDLAKLIEKLGYKPVIIQIGDEFFYKRHQFLDVIAVPLELFNNLKTIFKKEPALAIYSDILSAINKDFFHNNIILSHGISWDGPNKKFNIRDLNKFKRILTNAKQIVSVDTNTINWFKAVYGIAAHNVRMNYIPNYVDRNEFKPVNNPSDKIRILFPRRAIFERGYWLVSNAIDKLMARYDNLEFNFVGYVHTEDIKQDMERLKNTYKDKIITTIIEAQDMPKVYQNADITLIPTIFSEGTSLSCLEAMASGNAVIASNVGGLTNLIINNYNGILINANTEELIEALERLINDKILRQKFSQNALEVVKEFDKEKWERSWLQILNLNLGSKPMERK